MLRRTKGLDRLDFCYLVLFRFSYFEFRASSEYVSSRIGKASAGPTLHVAGFSHESEWLPNSAQRV